MLFSSCKTLHIKFEKFETLEVYILRTYRAIKPSEHHSFPLYLQLRFASVLML